MSSALSTLLRAAIDYAGLFPPASLELEVVVQNYRDYRQAPARSLLGRLIVPATRLAELASTMSEHSISPAQPWPISALVPPISQTADGQLDDTAFANAVALIDQASSEPRFLVDAIEVPAATAKLVRKIINQLPERITPFLEVSGDHAGDVIGEIAAVAAGGRAVFAKIRTGGVTPDLIPNPSQVADFIATCVSHRVGFKATAGLHHPLRSEQSLTYETAAPRAVMHGFINVFAATMLAFEHRLTACQIEPILTSTKSADFRFEPNEMTWQAAQNSTSYSITRERMVHWREAGLTAFGSCSFTEPTDEIKTFYPVDF